LAVARKLARRLPVTPDAPTLDTSACRQSTCRRGRSEDNLRGARSHAWLCSLTRCSLRVAASHDTILCRQIRRPSPKGIDKGRSASGKSTGSFENGREVRVARTSSSGAAGDEKNRAPGARWAAVRLRHELHPATACQAWVRRSLANVSSASRAYKSAPAVTCPEPPPACCARRVPRPGRRGGRWCRTPSRPAGP
jgi:hypothetical protein